MGRPKKSVNKKDKFPNGFGTIQTLSGNRKKPYQVVVTVGKKPNGKPDRKPLDTYADYWEAYDVLVKYNRKRYNINVSKMTFENVFESLKPQLEKEYEKCQKTKTKGMSKSNYKNLINAFPKWKEIHKEKVIDLKKTKLQKIIKESGLSNTGQGYMKNIAVRIIAHYIDDLEGPLEKNPALELTVIAKGKSQKYPPFKNNELKIIFENKDRFYIKILIVMLYSGMRPTEICELETKKTFLKEHYSIGGCKTEAGIDRILPHHEEIQWIYKEFYNSDNVYVFNNPNTNQKFTASNLSKNITKELKSLGIFNRSAYCARHNFATQLLYCNVSESNRKWLMGHSQKNDVTNNVYTHIDYKYLLNEINKLKYI